LPAEFRAIGLLPVESVTPSIARVLSERSFVTSLDDGVPVGKVTAIDLDHNLALEVTILRTQIVAKVRRATLAETRRQEALEGLKEAEKAECDAKGKSYDFLHGRIVTARARGVNQLRLDRAQAKLKTLQPNVASVDEVKSALQWEKVTMTERSMNGGVVGLEQCTEIGCSVSDPLPGQVLAFLADGASAALASVKDIKEKGVPHDQWLFERIAEAAVAAAADGGVWKSGGKYILSALSRNQSPTALKNYLTTMGQGKCAEGIDALVKWTEKQYKHSVSAIQINVHFDSTSFHAQVIAV